MQPEVRRKIEEVLQNPGYRNNDDSPQLRLRIEQELSGLGPLESLMTDEAVTEILVNGTDEIFFERAGHLQKLNDSFYSENSYLGALDRLAHSCGSYLSREKPFIEAQFANFRVSMVFGEIARGTTVLSIRKQPGTMRSLQDFYAAGSCTALQLSILHQIFSERANFLVTGATSSGKTSLLQAMINCADPLERLILLEDTRELRLPNRCSVSLLTRDDPGRQVSQVALEDLLKRALRLRPDRLFVGEIRGAEATALLLALSTGHDGSGGSLHGRNAHEALLRLEMLIQMGAPQWSLYSVRRLISLSIKNIVVMEKAKGSRKVSGIFEIRSAEETGLTLQRMDE